MPISSAFNPAGKCHVYLIDTNVVSETRKKERANPGVVRFFDRIAAFGEAVYLCVVSVGELRRGVELIRHRAHAEQANRLDPRLTMILDQYRDNSLPFEADATQVCGPLRVRIPVNRLDNQIAEIALVNAMAVVTRNTADFEGTGVKLINPFLPEIFPG